MKEYVYHALLMLTAVANLRAQDTTPPTLVSAAAVLPSEVTVCFSEALEPASAVDEFNYGVIDDVGALTIQAISLQRGGTAVSVAFDRPINGSTFAVIVSGVKDLALNVVGSDSMVTGRYWGQHLAFADVGSPTPAGAWSTCEEGRLAVAVGGDNFGGTADQFAFGYLLRTNDFDVKVLVSALEFIGADTSKAGLMARSTLDANGAFFTVYATPVAGANYLQARFRTFPGVQTFDLATRLNDYGLPVWLRLKRAGTVFSAYASHDGEQWAPLGIPQAWPQFPAVIPVGLATVSRLDGTAARAEYSNFADTLLHSNAVITITEHPTNVTAEENTHASFTVVAAAQNAPMTNLQYQWQAETGAGSEIFTNIHFATAQTYRTPFLSSADDRARFRALVSLPGHSPRISAAATLTVGPDVTGPRALSAGGTRNLWEILVTFSELLDATSAQQASNYTLAGHTITSATLDGTGHRVLLRVDSMLQPGSTNLVAITGVRDALGHLMEPQTIAAQTLIIARGFALQELYAGVLGDRLLQLREASKFPSTPDETGYVALLEGPQDQYDHYGTRISGFLAPEASTNYHFLMCSDDEGEFWLSTDENPANRVLICREPQWMGYRNYTDAAVGQNVLRNSNAPENRSSTLFPNGIPLVAGRLYYFEALAKEGWGGDNLAVVWHAAGTPLPTNGALPISSQFLAVLAPAGSAIQFLEQPRDVFYEFNPPVGETVYGETFAAGGAGYTVSNTGTADGPWTYGAGNWFANGSANNQPSSSALTSPAFPIPRSGRFTLRLTHRYSFEYDGTGWDGGQIHLSVNGSPFQLVGAGGFCARGYDRIIQGGGVLIGQPGFNGASPGAVVSVANLGTFNAGDTLQFRFVASWDWSILAGQPSWLIDEIIVAEGECAAPATFTATALASVPGEAAQPIQYQWQRDCGSGFADVPGATAAAYTFVPVIADVACRFRCVATTLSMSVTSSVARITIGPIHLQARRQGLNVVITWNGAGTLQHAQNLTGPWAIVAGVTSNTLTIRPSGPAARRFYRMRVP